MEDTKELKDTTENENNTEEITSLVESKSEENKDKDKDKDESLPEFKLDNLNLSKSNIVNILEDLRIIKKRFNHIENVIREAERAQYSPSRDLPGVVGIYDGEFMTTSEGVRHEVPKNYAAKSLLVNGDELKMMEQDGKFAFKVVKKVARKKIEGLLSKKDGKYVILSDAGTFNLLKPAVEFRNIKQGEWVLALIPETGSTNNFAAVDKIIKKEPKKEIKFYEKPKKEVSLSHHQSYTTQHHDHKTSSKPVIHNLPPKKEVTLQSKPVESNSKPQNQPQAQKPSEPPKSPMPKIQFSDDDLV
jgi:hypothetical protein